MKQLTAEWASYDSSIRASAAAAARMMRAKSRVRAAQGRRLQRVLAGSAPALRTKTPCALRLEFEMPGHERAVAHIESSVSGWYFGNLLFGGLIGMLIVDPLTGAMYNLYPDKIEQPLSAAQAQVIHEGKGLLVVLASQATEQERANMVRIN